MTDLASLVEPRLGNTIGRWISFAAACRPLGLVALSPDTRIDYPKVTQRAQEEARSSQSPDSDVSHATNRMSTPRPPSLCGLGSVPSV